MCLCTVTWIFILDNNPYDRILKALNVGGKEYKYYDIAALDSCYGKYCIQIVLENSTVWY